MLIRLRPNLHKLHPYRMNMQSKLKRMLLTLTHKQARLMTQWILQLVIKQVLNPY